MVIAYLLAWMGLSEACEQAAVGENAASPQFENPSERKFLCGKALLRVVTIQDAEDETVVVSALDPVTEEALFPAVTIKGTFLSLCREEKFALVDTSVHYRTGPSFLLTADMRVIATFDFGELAKVEKSEDDRMFWVQWFSVEDRKPITNIAVFSSDGQELTSRKFSSETQFRLQFNKSEYLIDVLRPAYPG